MTIIELIERLEAATEGSLELSWLVAEALGWSKYWSGHTIYLPPGETEEWAQEHPDVSGATTVAPCFTTSIDAALTLVPEGFGWTLNHFWNLPWAVSFSLRLFSPHEEPAIKVFHKKPALALCVAALKARQPGEGIHDQTHTTMLPKGE